MQAGVSVNGLESLLRLAGDEGRRCWMLQRIRRMREVDEHGFTLIELLVVILIIAILAAIAIPVFLRQREKGYISQSQSALKNAATAQESYLANPANAAYATGAAGLTALETDEGLKYAGDVTLAVVGNGATDYCITATHGALPAGHVWRVSTYDSDEGEPDSADAC
jgi:type IV pilus assembly protein PilA